MTRADIPMGLLLAVVCLVVLWQATALPYSAEFTPGSGFFPFWLALIGAGLAFVIALNAWRTSELPASPSGHGGWTGLLRAGAGAGGLVAVIVLMPLLGFLVGILAYLVFLTLVVERLSPPLGLGVSVGTVAIVYLVFTRLLAVPFPRGPLGF